MPTQQIRIGANESKQILPYNPRRVTLLIRVIEGTGIYISHERGNVDATGMLLLYGDALSFNKAWGDETELELNAMNTTANEAKIAIWESYGKS